MLADLISGLSVSLALNTPNGSGEYVGRILYIREGNRIRAITLTFVGSLSQLIVTMLMGTFGLIILRDHFLNGQQSQEIFSHLTIVAAIYACIILTAVMLAVYFEISWLTKLLERIPIVAKFSYYIQKLEDFGWHELLKVLAISFARYFVFVIQYLLLLQLFNVGIELATSFWLITVMFLVLAIILYKCITHKQGSRIYT